MIDELQIIYEVRFKKANEALSEIYRQVMLAMNNLGKVKDNELQSIDDVQYNLMRIKVFAQENIVPK